MAFEASRSDRAFEVGGAIDITGTVRPSAGRGPVGDRKFEELITAPIQVSLPFSAGSDDEINTLCLRFLLPVFAGDRGFEEGTIFRIHAKVHLWVERRHGVFA